MLGRKVIYVRCIKCSYNNVAKGIRFLDKKAFFGYIGKISCKKELLKDISLNTVHDYIKSTKRFDNTRSYLLYSIRKFKI